MYGRKKGQERRRNRRRIPRTPAELERVSALMTTIEAGHRFCYQVALQRSRAEPVEFPQPAGNARNRRIVRSASQCGETKLEPGRAT